MLRGIHTRTPGMRLRSALSEITAGAIGLKLTVLRSAFRVHERLDFMQSRLACRSLEDARPAGISRDHPGRFHVRLSYRFCCWLRLGVPVQRKTSALSSSEHAYRERFPYPKCASVQP